MGVWRDVNRAADGLGRVFLTPVVGVFHARGGKGGYVGAKRRRSYRGGGYRAGYVIHKRRRRKGTGRSTRS